jgi:FtsH-binding integral membrane protein
MDIRNNCSVHPQQTYAVLTLEKIMKKLVLAATVSLAATTAFAGGMAEPIMDAPVVAAETSSSSGGVVVALLLLLVIAAAASN